jgi:hypothetical protein
MPTTKSEVFWEIQRINKYHDRESFDCGEGSLNTFLQKHARQNDEKNIGRTFVAVKGEKRRVEGYYTISAGMVEFENLPEKLRARLPRYPVPMVTLGRLAVDLRVQGKRLGETLLLHALRSTWDINNRVAVFGIVVDAKHEQAERFYAKYGFLALPDHPLRLILTMRKIEHLFP